MTKKTDPVAGHFGIVAAIVFVASCVGGGVAGDLHFTHTAAALEGVATLIVIWWWVVRS